ncbi:MAG TPA: cobalt-precorrin-7 (C(5))-methyltransferase [Symbiobacteriaceae bacterium]|jgi:hypothetical protein
MNQRERPVVEIVGMLDDGPDSLTAKTLRIVAQAEVLVGGRRQLDFFPDHPAEKWPIQGPLDGLVARIGAEGRRVVVLSSGDPNFYGIAGVLIAGLGPVIILARWRTSGTSTSRRVHHISGIAGHVRRRFPTTW